MEKTMCELFAGVGGFRLGMERLNSGWKTVWFSQWEPGKKNQWAHDCYVSHFGDLPDKNGEFHTGDDIASVAKENIPDHTLLVGGFPCQDYSVAHSLSSSRGIEGKKGVLWWQICDTITACHPFFCLFENVDRLLKSPASQRGRDFGIILFCLSRFGYSAEWRVVNAAQCGAAQRRRRTFLFAWRDDTQYGISIKDVAPSDLLRKDGLMARAFPVCHIGDIRHISLPEDIMEVSDTFSFPFENAGYLHNGKILTANLAIAEETPVPLKAVLEPHVDCSFQLPTEKMEKWKYLKGAKRIERTAKNGHHYVFSEGSIAFPDDIDKPSRTMLTSESTLNRSTHVVRDSETGNLRVLTPGEAERLNGFDDNWTQNTVHGEMPSRMRYFCMGNALVVPMITRMGTVLDQIVEEEP